MTRDQIIAEARTWIGVPWRHKGRSRTGVDCAGMPLEVLRTCGAEIPSELLSLEYGAQPDGYALLDLLKAHLQSVPVKARRPGDVAVFLDNRNPRHIGILSMKNGREHVVHARYSEVREKRKVVETPLEGEMWNRLVCVFGIPSIED